MPVTTLDPTTTALVLIDLQKGIVAMPAQPRSSDDVIANALLLAEKFRALGSPVVLVHVAMSGSGRLALEADEMIPPRQLPPDASDIVPALLGGENDIVILKRQWGAFYGTDLDLQLRRRGVRTIVIGGISTNYGVETTARDGWERNYQMVFAEDAMASRSADDHAFAVTRIFPRLGHVDSTSAILSALEAGADTGA